MLNGQKLQGPQTSAEVYRILEKRAMVNKWVYTLRAQRTKKTRDSTILYKRTFFGHGFVLVRHIVCVLQHDKKNSIACFEHFNVNVLVCSRNATINLPHYWVQWLNVRVGFIPRILASLEKANIIEIKKEQMKTFIVCEKCLFWSIYKMQSEGTKKN